MSEVTNQRQNVCVAGILAGGGSQRMGTPKALITLPNGKTIIEHVADVVSTMVRDVVVLGQAIPLPPSLAALPVLPDAKPAGGPLAGLCSLLECAGDRWGLLLACDMPKLGKSLLGYLLSQNIADVDAVTFARKDQPDVFHVCCALYHPRILTAARDELFQGKGSLQKLLNRISKMVLQPSVEQSQQLINVNSPEDLGRCGITSQVSGHVPPN